MFPKGEGRVTESKSVLLMVRGQKHHTRFAMLRHFRVNLNDAIILTGEPSSLEEAVQERKHV